MSKAHAPASRDMKFVGDTESAIYCIPGPASSHKQIFQSSYLLILQQVATQQTFLLLCPSGTK